MAGPAHRWGVAERLADCLVRAGDPRTLRLQVLELLGEVIPYDAYAWLLTDPETAVGASPIADVPCLPRLPELIRLKYLTEVNRWTTLPGSVARLHDVTSGNLSRSRLWTELLAEYDVVDVISVVFADAHGCWGFLDLWRIGQQQVFTAEEEDLLLTVAGIVTPALRELQARSFLATSTGLAQDHGAGPVVLLLSPELAVLTQTAETEAYLRTIVPTEEARRPVPATAYNVGAQLLAVETGVDEHAPMTRLHLLGGQWVTMSAARLGATGPSKDRAIAVTLQTTSPTDRMALFARASALTARETEVVRQLRDGTDTRHLAQSLGVSQYTVQDYLKSIFAKTSTSSRLQLAARAFGN